MRPRNWSGVPEWTTDSISPTRIIRRRVERAREMTRATKLRDVC